ncbi:MAG: tetratricopeptide repeat protein, partial [Gemmatimonadales bacterium]
MSSRSDFAATLRRTRLTRVLLVYLGGSFAALEAVDLLGDKMALPDWVFAGAVVLLVIGLPIVIATALIQAGPGDSPPSVAPSGDDRREAPVGSRGGARRILTWRNAVTGGVVAAALWGVAVSAWLVLNDGRPETGAEADRPSDRQMLVVLPFENLGSEQDEYFADGITDAITARLASLQGLGVISRQSAVQYKNSPMTAGEIGTELGVDYILEGTIQRERPSDPASRVRVIPQLIRTADDTHVWAATYDEDLSEVFRVQSEIAERVARALDVTVLDPERRSLESRPTENLAAYDYYLRGNEYFNRGQLGYLDLAALTAVELYENAVELDTQFALAWAALARAHTLVYDNDYDNTDERLERAREAAETALRLDPDLPEAHLALGGVFVARRDYDSALQQFEIARSERPDNAELLRAVGGVLGARNRWPDAIPMLEEAVALDPRSAGTARDLGDALYRAGRYAEAEAQFDRAILLAPDEVLPYVGKLDLYLRAMGDTASARRVIEEGSRRMGSLVFGANLLSQDYSYFRLLGEDFAAVLDELSIGSFGHDTVSHFFYHLARGWRHTQLGDAGAAAASYDSARVVLENGLRRWLNDAFWRRELGIALAGLGRKNEAVAEARRAVELVPPAANSEFGAENLARLSQV